MQTGFNLALELTNVFPVREGLRALGEIVLKLARDLRKSGSDLVVEADLAQVFGRGKITQQLETTFKETTKITKITPLHDGSEVVLASGPGPTLQHAFRNPDYLSSVLQLSFLSWVHPQDQLALMLSTSLHKRFIAGVPDASPDPGYEGISRTLFAINSQSSFNWGRYIKLVQSKLEAAIPDYAHSSDYLRLTPSLLLASMDYLFLVQKLPEDRKVTVSGETGGITLIVWAHYILGLTVAVVLSQNEAIVFGDKPHPHVTILWSNETRAHTGEFSWPDETEDEGPIIRLLDENMSIVLETAPETDRRGLMTDVQERHPVADYGTAYLHRLFNRNMIIHNEDPMYEESINVIVAIAINANERLYRECYLESKGSPRNPPFPVPQRFSVEVWRILSAARIIFKEFPINTGGIESYTKFLSQNILDGETCPNTFRAFINRAPFGRSSFAIAVENLFGQLRFLAEVVLLFAHVANVEDCQEMPIILNDQYPLIPNVLSIVCNDLDKRANVKSYTLFHSLTKLLTGEMELDQTDRPMSSRTSFFLFLCSDFGWSIFLDSVGDKDPSDCRVDLLRVQRGTPMNSLTGERKRKLRDGTGFFVRSDYPQSYNPIRGRDYLPRSCAKVAERKEYWNSRADEFECTLYFCVYPSLEWRQLMPEDTPSVDQITGYRGMHDSLWRVLITPAPCGHCIEAHVEEPITLGPDAVAILGWRRDFESLGTTYACTERILILLTRSDRRLRWLAISNAIRDNFWSENWDEHSRRLWMLRSNTCCERCALDYAAQTPGRWVLIL